ncbi:hypothetical protein K503DRAFT_473821 [Rhizopogon vinicolor AM-OR11-026]|uniref:Uncharacterized protein n=1 Tax=Rhizopogon vinicolor AM-OR11-026 TaxID=1314800 RepID=A0A1B7MN88_9AGAM|nr:hypothetical protein K503DRAFT_473821 [Rhizopogon vinicolor AM-OR11-026]
MRVDWKLELSECARTSARRLFVIIPAAPGPPYLTPMFFGPGITLRASIPCLMDALIGSTHSVSNPQHIRLTPNGEGWNSSASRKQRHLDKKARHQTAGCGDGEEGEYSDLVGDMESRRAKKSPLTAA